MTTLRNPAPTASPSLSMPAHTPAGGHLSPTTRYLCSAAFLVPGFADAVVGELIGEQCRCVPPSHGFDLDPVLRQCFRARRLNLIRQSTATVLYLLAAVLSWPTVVVLTLVGGVVRLLRSATLRSFRRRFRLGRVSTLIAGYFILSLIGGMIALVAAVLASHSPGSSSGNSNGDYPADPDATVAPQVPPGLRPAAAVLILLILFGVFFLFRRAEYQIVMTEFAADRSYRRYPLRDSIIEDRITYIASSQRGNVIVHHDDPFLGCGKLQQGWSFSVTLRPAAPAGDNSSGHPVAIDPVALNERLKEAVGSMRAPWLDDGARVAGVSVRPYVVADGIRAEDDPLIDPNVGMPYTMADEATIDAIVANPQGGLRQYLRVVVPVRGKAIQDAGHRVILNAQELGISVSAFVHVAVEGGMLYAEFLGTVLPPLRAECRLADTLRPGRVTSYAFAAASRTGIVDVVAGPVLLALAVARAINLRWVMHRSGQKSREFRTNDYGARLSVRDLASAVNPESYLQKLDGIKYVKLAERVIGEAIVDFLVQAGVDPLEFQQAVNHITMQNGNFVQIDTVSGGQNNFSGNDNVFTTTPGGTDG